ncbi:MAG: AMMECR1 domain-containing protein [Acidobacteriota bacterium]
MLEETERDLLRKFAAAAAARALGLRGALAPAIPGGSALLRPASVFVTWVKDGRARGRSGAAATASPLHILVEQHAVEALLHDPRVPPVTAKELARHTPQISVLSPFEEISSPSDVTVGIHGVVAEKGKRWGIVLPQDAEGLDWDADRLLGQACLRAGLPEESWKAAGSVHLRRFTAETF